MALSTASPSPPSGQWSSTVTIRPVSPRRRPQRGRIGGLDRVRVDDPGGNTVLGEQVGSRQRLVHRHARRDERHLVVGRLAQHPAAADLETLSWLVDDGRVAPADAQVADAFEVRHRPGQPRCLVGVAGAQHGTAVHGAHRGQVLEAHLGRAVLADRHSGVRAGQPDAGPAHRRHPDEVKRPGEEGRERGRVGDPAAHLHPDGRGEHLLLGDVELEEPVWVPGRHG